MSYEQAVKVIKFYYNPRFSNHYLNTNSQERIISKAEHLIKNDHYRL